MKKVVSLILTLALIAVAYSASAWYIGQFVEDTIGKQYDSMLAGQPYLKIVSRDYQRGIFQSDETLTLAFADMPPALKQLDPEGGAATDTPLQLTLHTRIQHGPLPGFSGFGAAVTESELVLPEKAEADINHLLGGNNPFSHHTLINFDGSGSGSFSSPSFEITVPDPEGNQLSVTWKGIQGRVEFAPEFRSFKLQLQAPKLSITDGGQTEVLISDIAMDSTQQRAFDDLPLVYTGRASFSIDELTFVDKSTAHPPLTLKQLVYEVDVPMYEDYLDLVARFGAASLTVGEDDIGPTHMDFSFRHLHARSFAELYQELMSLYSDPLLLDQEPQQLMGQFQQKLAPHVETILANNPQFKLDRVSFANTDGEARLAAQIKLNGARLEELFNPPMLLAKAEASGDLTLSEKMVVQLLLDPPFAKQFADSEADAETVAAQGAATAEQFQAQVAMLSEQGYLTRDNDLIKTSMAFKDGMLTVNGKPFNPAAMAPQPMHGPTEQEQEQVREQAQASTPESEGAQ